jgi:metal-dependent amidase/aminoacylase/carboxypeptidase family protein
MASVLLEAPGCYMMVGSGQSDPELSFGHHHPKFTIDENVLPRAAALMSATALNVLRHLGNRQE